MDNKNISIIVAMARNGAIGIENRLPWHISNDLKRFKALTSGHTVVMGRLTFESLPNGPLPKRRNIVLSKKNAQILGCEVAGSIDEVVAMTKNETEVFVIGGGKIYAQFLPIAHKLYLTIVDKEVEADTFFPEIDLSNWELTEKTIVENDSLTNFIYSFETYNRKQ